MSAQDGEELARKVTTMVKAEHPDNVPNQVVGILRALGNALLRQAVAKGAQVEPDRTLAAAENCSRALKMHVTLGHLSGDIEKFIEIEETGVVPGKEAI